jgi:hypothetical protein
VVGPGEMSRSSVSRTAVAPGPGTESYHHTQFNICSKCKVVVYFYCSHDSQVEDWICKEAVKDREQIVRAGKLMQGLSDLSLAGGRTVHRRFIRFNYHKAHRNPAVRERHRQLRAEKKRPKVNRQRGLIQNTFLRCSCPSVWFYIFLIKGILMGPQSSKSTASVSVLVLSRAKGSVAKEVAAVSTLWFRTKFVWRLAHLVTYVKIPR